ncbi:DMT family transporter [Nakamurella aerolata]|uniref:DMT family transporter n=1 Tax=Nakamurella aerolata TaxID=1656892 RepID=A0A849A7E4_9ACTN|nr:DMT family transporter [Nakamurella aerolata]NNG34420.1 DMT family transporter [Nakamurella aerolata]
MTGDRRSLGWSIGFVLCWSSGFVGAVLAEPAGSTAGVLAWRYLVTAVLLLAVTMGRWHRLSRTELLRQAVIGLLAHVVFLGGVFAATAGGVSAGAVALVCGLQPMLVLLAGRIGWGDAVSARQVIGLGLGFGAVAIAVGGDASGSAGLLVLPVASVLALSGAALLERRWRPQLDAPTALTVQVTVSAVVFAGFAMVTHRLSVALSWQLIGALSWLVLLSGIGGYLCFVMCLRRLGSTGTSLLLYLTPAVTTMWVWLMLGQPPTLWQWLGLGIGALAVALAWPRPTAAAQQPEPPDGDQPARSNRGVDPGLPPVR